MTATKPTNDVAGKTQTAAMVPWWSQPVMYAIALLSTLTALWVSVRLPGLFGSGPLLMFFLIPVALSAYLGGLGPGLVATALAALLAVYFILPPTHSFQITKPEDALRLTLFILTGSTLSWLHEALHRSWDRVAESQRRYAVTLESIGEAVITTDKQGRITLLNGQAERLTGWTNLEARGQPLAAVFNIVHEKTREPVDDPVKKVLARGLVVGLANHTVLRSRQGREIPIDDSGAPIKQHNGEIIGVVLVFRDCTDRKRAGNALALFRALIDRISDGIEVVDPVTGQFLDVNENACLNLGYTREEMLTLTIYDIDPLIKAADREASLNRLRMSELVVDESVHRRKDGTMFPVELNKQLIRLDREYIVVVARDITERKQAERMLKLVAQGGWTGQPEDFLAQLVEHIGRSLGVDYAFVGRLKDAQTVRTIGNYAHGKIIPDTEYTLAGAPCQNVVGKSLWHHGQRLQEMFPDNRLLKEAGAHSFLGLPLADSSGNPVGLLAVLDSKPMPDPRRATALLQIAAIRVAGELERLAAETTLRESETRYRTLFESMLEGYACCRMIFDQGQPRDFVYVNVNPAFERLTGLKNVSGRNVSEVIPGIRESNPELFEVYGRVTLTGQPEKFEVYVAPLQTWFSVTAYSHQKDHFVAVFDNITERKQTEELQKRLATAVEQAAEDIVITDEMGNIIYVNPAFERITGYSRESVIGSNPRILKSGVQDESFYQTMWDTLRRGEVWSGHVINKRKDGTLFEQEATISPIRDSAGKITNYVGVRRDVTREMALETQLRQSQKLEAIGRLAGGVAHDFNNLLTAIRGNASMVLLCDQAKSPEISDCAQQIVEAAERAANLTRQLLMFSRQQNIQPIAIDLNAVAGRMTKLLQRILGEDISLVANYSPGLPSIQADTGMIEQVLLNLAVNSRDAMPNGGKLMITTDTTILEPETTGAESGAMPGRYVRITVADNGTGIAPENLPHIFEPFFSTKEVGKGTGLGLATVHGIVLQHNGLITVASEINQGTTFRICFPALSGQKTINSPAPANPELPTGSETILVVEDDQIVRLTVCTMLQRFGYTVLAAESGREALSIWEQEKERIQLLLTDIVMPDGLSGFELANRLQSDDPTLPVIYTSGYSSDLADKRLALTEGVNFLQKPYAPEKLATALRTNFNACGKGAGGILEAKTDQTEPPFPKETGSEGS